MAKMSANGGEPRCHRCEYSWPVVIHTAPDRFFPDETRQDYWVASDFIDHWRYQYRDHAAVPAAGAV